VEAREYLDLFADVERSEEAIGDFAGLKEARAFRRLTAQARRVYDTLDRTFMRAPRPSPWVLARRVGLGRLHDLMSIQPFATLWQAMEAISATPGCGSCSADTPRIAGLRRFNLPPR